MFNYYSMCLGEELISKEFLHNTLYALIFIVFESLINRAKEIREVLG